MPLQPRTSRTGSVLPLLGSDSNSNSNSSYLLRPEIGGLQAERICQHLPFPGLPPLDLPPLPPLCERSFSQQQPPPSTSTRIRVRQPVTAPYLPRSQQGLSHPTSPTPTMFPTPTTNPYDDWTTRSFTPPDFSPLGPLTRLPSPYSIPIPPMQLLPSFTPHYPPQRFSRTATQVGGALPTILEGPEKLEKALRALSRPAYLMLSISAALLNINAFNNNSITKVPLMIATTASFFAVMTHWVATLQLHASQSVRHIKRPLVVLVAFLGVSVFATVFALPAHSWSQEECNPYCWVERALVSIVVVGGFASLMIGGWRMREGDGQLAA